VDAIISSYNSSDDTYNLDLRPSASIDRIRARSDVLPSDASGSGSGGPVPGASVLEAATPQKVGPGRVQFPAKLVDEGASCVFAEQRPGTDGLTWMQACIQCVNHEFDTYVVMPISSPQRLLEVGVDMIRAPAGSTEAWPPGTQVAYESSSLGAWVPTTVVSFNVSDNTYNLECREFAAPQRVRPRSCKE